MKKIFNICVGLAATIIVIASCKTSQVVANKPGAQLWAENCVRCHYAPSPPDYNDKQWDIISTHMQIRASITEEERIKILEFLQTAN